MERNKACKDRIAEIEARKPRESEILFDKLLEEEEAGFPLPLGDEEIKERIDKAGWQNKPVTKWVAAEIYGLIRGTLRYRDKIPGPTPDVILAALSQDDKKRLEMARRMFEAEFRIRLKQLEKEFDKKIEILKSEYENAA